MNKVPLTINILKEQAAYFADIISNALQWRLQYNRVIQKAGEVDGIWKIR